MAVELDHMIVPARDQREPARRTPTAVLLALALLVGAPATAGTVRDVPAGELGFLQIEIDDGWKETRVPRGAMAALAIEAREPGRMALLVSGLPSDRRGDAQLREIVAKAADRIGPQSVEKRLDIRALEGGQASGYYVRATESAPRAGGFRHVHQGALAVGPLLVTFTLLHNDGAEPEARAVLDALRGMRFRAAEVPR